MKQKKILIFAITDNDFMSHRYELIQGLIIKKHKVFLVANPGPDISKLESLGAKYIPVVFDSRSINPLKDILLILKYKRILKRIKPDLVFTFYTKTNIYGSIASRICGIPYITTITGLGTALENPGIKQHILLNLYRIALRKASNIIYQNEPNMRFMHSNNIRTDLGLLVSGSGVNIEHFSFTEYPAEDDIQFLFLSRVMKEKGIEEYLEAAKHFHKINPRIKFHVVGDTIEYINELKKLEENGIIKYHGKQADVRPFIKMCCCTIFPSYYPEGMANVILESAACGRPVITTDRPGCIEAVYNNITGLIVRPMDSSDLIKKIKAFISMSYEEKKEMGRMARKKMEVEFNRNNIVSEYLNEIENMFEK